MAKPKTQPAKSAKPAFQNAPPEESALPAAETTQEQAAAGSTEPAADADAPAPGMPPSHSEGERPEGHKVPGEGESLPAAPDEAPTVAALIVTAKTEGFRRAGRAWSREPTRVEAGELTDDQVEALFAEPMLDVVGVAE